MEKKITVNVIHFQKKKRKINSLNLFALKETQKRKNAWRGTQKKVAEMEWQKRARSQTHTEQERNASLNVSKYPFI